MSHVVFPVGDSVIRVEERVEFVGRFDPEYREIINRTPHAVTVATENSYIDVLAVTFDPELSREKMIELATQKFQTLGNGPIIIGSMLAQQNGLCELAPYTVTDPNYRPGRDQKGQIAFVNALCFYI